MKKSFQALLVVFLHGFIGALLGIVLGVLVGIGLWGMEYLLLILSEFIQNLKNAPKYGPQLRNILYLTASFGCLLGAIFGSIVGLKAADSKK